MKSERSEWHDPEEYHARHLSPTPHALTSALTSALARAGRAVDIARVTNDQPAPARDEEPLSDEERIARDERAAYDAQRLREAQQRRVNPLYFGIVAATIQRAVLLWFMYC